MDVVIGEEFIFVFMLVFVFVLEFVLVDIRLLIF